MQRNSLEAWPCGTSPSKFKDWVKGVDNECKCNDSICIALLLTATQKCCVSKMLLVLSCEIHTNDISKEIGIRMSGVLSKRMANCAKRW